MASHLSVENFNTFAGPQLEIATPWETGVCFLPECGRDFEPARPWQIYCCRACEQRGVAEFRKWGHRLAMSSLVHRMGKYEREDQGLRALSRAARRHVGAVQSAWVEDRRERAEGRPG
ncbi:MAG TPA: hypothetical protein DIT40_08950 [Alphaproteobacteria bacterium]|nr:hypothetical protein [Alphaproteobacteria bacterium]